MKRKVKIPAGPQPLINQTDLPGLSFAETFMLINPETEWGTLKIKANLASTQDMFTGESYGNSQK